MKYVWYSIVISVFAFHLANGIMDAISSVWGLILALPFIIVGLPGGLLCSLLTTHTWAMLLIGFPLYFYLWTHHGN